MNQVSREDWRLIQTAIARLRASVMAVVFAMVGGFGLWLATAWLLIRGGKNVGFHLGLLSNYFPGYQVTWVGSFVGLFYGALVGAVMGWSVALVYNTVAAMRSGERT